MASGAAGLVGVHELAAHVLLVLVVVAVHAFAGAATRQVDDALELAVEEEVVEEPEAAVLGERIRRQIRVVTTKNK